MMLAYLLVIDPRDWVREVMVDILRQNDFEALGIRPSEMRSELARRRPDLIVLDVTASEAVRTSEQMNMIDGIPSVLISADLDASRILKTERPPPILKKPFRQQHLIAAVKKGLRFED